MKYLKPLELYLKRGGLLGVEVRASCIYAAHSVADNRAAMRLDMLAKTTRGVADLKTLQSWISKHSVSGLVIGYPFEREVSLRTAGVQAKRFVDDLARTGKFEDMYYTLWDETLKSKDLRNEMMQFKCEPWSLSTVLDKYTGWEILQGYLDFFNQNQEQTFEGEHGYLDFIHPYRKDLNLRGLPGRRKMKGVQ